jgi:hypothetical protein
MASECVTEWPFWPWGPGAHAQRTGAQAKGLSQKKTGPGPRPPRPPPRPPVVAPRSWVPYSLVRGVEAEGLPSTRKRPAARSRQARSGNLKLKFYPIGHPLGPGGSWFAGSLGWVWSGGSNLAPGPLGSVAGDPDRHPIGPPDGPMTPAATHPPARPRGDAQGNVSRQLAGR